MMRFVRDESSQDPDALGLVDVSDPVADAMVLLSRRHSLRDLARPFCFVLGCFLESDEAFANSDEANSSQKAWPLQAGRWAIKKNEKKAKKKINKSACHKPRLLRDSQPLVSPMHLYPNKSQTTKTL